MLYKSHILKRLLIMSGLMAIAGVTGLVGDYLYSNRILNENLVNSSSPSPLIVVDHLSKEETSLVFRVSMICLWSAIVFAAIGITGRLFVSSKS